MNTRLKTILLCTIACITITILLVGAIKRNAATNTTTYPLVVDSIWTTYWDTEDSLSEIKALGGQLKEVVHFAVYFDSKGDFILPQQTMTMFKEIKSQTNIKHHIISFVNDIKLDKGSSLKDKELLSRLFADDTAMNKHVADIIAITTEHGFDAIEIDYENIRDDLTLWKKYTVFCAKLIDAAKAKKLTVRFVLEPSTPFSQLTFPEGAQYIIMCYNLYGSHSGPGAKADAAFLKKLDIDSKTVSNRVFALATGGYDWTNKGNAVGITEKKAKELIQQYKIIPQRAADSYALFFNYTDSKGALHTVYFADKETLLFWQNTLNVRQIHLWRAGGNIF